MRCDFLSAGLLLYVELTMRFSFRRGSLLACSFVLATLAIACGGESVVPPTAPASIPPNVTTSSPAVTQVTVQPNYLPAFIGEVQQFKMFAAFTDGTRRDVTADTKFESSDITIAGISPTGLLTPIQPGKVEIRGTFQGVEGKYSIDVTWGMGKAPGQLYGRIKEAGSEAPYLYGEVEIVGGEYAGRIQRAIPEFLFTGIYHAGFDLIARSTGYQSGRYRVGELPANPIIELQPDPSLVSEVLEASVCPQQPASRSFKTSSGGILRLTGVRFGYYEGGPGVRVLLPGGIPARPSNADERVYDFPKGSELELRISLDFECTTFRVNYLRPKV
jgi:Big-like domain-containing protein